MTIKHRLPPREVFDRYAMRTRYNLISGYHRKLTSKHRWYVRSLTDYYYCDGDRPADEGVEIFNCDWTPDVWDSVPYRHFYNPVDGVWYADYAKQGLPTLHEYGYGYRREDSLITRGGERHFVYFVKGNTFVWWHPNDNSRPLKVVHDGLYSQVYADGSITQGIFSSQEGVKQAIQEPLISAIMEMRKKHYRGFYDDLATEIIERFGVSRNRL